MAVYYVDPFIGLGSGNGTWASPYAMNNTTRTALVAGDEVRIVAKYINDILTATTYTATFSGTSITLSAGDADWVTGNIAYFPDYGTFAKVRTKSGTILGFQSGGMVPIPMITPATINVRRVDPAIAIANTSASLYFTAGNYTSLNNLTITDGWVADGVRVTDSSVISLMHSTQANVNYYLHYMGGVSGEGLPTGWTYDCGRTAMLGGVGANANISVYMPARTCTMTFFQIFSASNSSACLIGGNGSLPVLDSVTLNITHYNCAAFIGSSLLTKALTMNVTNYYTNNSGYWSQPALQATGTANFDTATITIGSYFANSTPSAIALLFTQDYLLGRMSVTFTDAYKANFALVSSNYGMSRTFGNYDVSFGANFKIYEASGTQMTSFPRKWGINGSVTWPGSSVNMLIVPGIATPPGVTFSATQYDFQLAGSLRPWGNGSPSQMMLGEVPPMRWVSLPDSVSYNVPQWNARSGNVLVTFRDGTTDPIELLGVRADYRTDNPLAAAQTPRVTIDATQFVTTGVPSLRSYLTTYSASNHSYSYCTKTIKIPVTAGVARTVTGWVKSNSAILDGDIRLRITINNTVLASQSMLSNASYTWRQFTLTFTPSYTGEANLCWDHRFSAGAQGFWLADLTIT